MLVVNADDWGHDRCTADSILACCLENRVHQASAMTLMKDSEGAAELASEYGIPVGLHLNLIEKFSGKAVSLALREHHQNIVAQTTFSLMPR